MKKKTVTELAAGAVCIFAVALGIFIAFRYLLPALLPFLIAFAVASAASKPAEFLARKARAGREVFCGIIMVLLLLAVCLAVIFGTARLAFEIKEFAVSYTGDIYKSEAVLNRINDFISSLSEKLRFSGDSAREIGELLTGALKAAAENLITSAAGALQRAATYIIRILPVSLLFITVTIISMFYIGCGKDKLNRMMPDIPGEVRKKISRIGNGAAGTVWKYIRAYALLFAICCICLFIGFSLLSIKYAFLLALLISVLDMLPVIGLGTVLIPWGIFEIATGNVVRGFGILAVFAVATTIRELAEPKILGKTLGIHPLITLVCMYSGLRLFGLAGLILLPAAAVGVKAVLAEKNKSSAVGKRSF